MEALDREDRRLGDLAREDTDLTDRGVYLAPPPRRDGMLHIHPLARSGCQVCQRLSRSFSPFRRYLGSWAS